MDSSESVALKSIIDAMSALHIARNELYNNRRRSSSSSSSSSCSSSSSSSTQSNRAASAGLGSWNGDSALEAMINNLKVGATPLSNACTRLALVFSTVFSKDAVNQVISEIEGDVENLGRLYMDFINCPCGWLLFEKVTHEVRSMLVHTHRMVLLVRSKGAAVEEVRNSAGMVWESNDMVQALPTSNEELYKEVMLQNISAVKDACKEFNGYLEEYKTLTADGKTIDPKLYEEDEEGNMQYMPHEIEIVSKCLSLLRICKNSLEVGYVTITFIGSDTSKMVLTSSDGAQEMTSETMKWISHVVPQYKQLESAVIDLVNELFPRIDEAPVVSLWTDLQRKLQAFLHDFNEEFVKEIILKKAQLVKKFEVINANTVVTCPFESIQIDI